MTPSRPTLDRLWRRGRWKARQTSARWRARATGVHRRLAEPDSVALTFDDGPDPLHTPAVLDVLAELKVPATFFCVGEQVRSHPEIVERMVREGHRVGSHSETHRDVGTLPFLELVSEFRAGRRALEQALGRPSSLFRPPKGDISRRTIAAMRLAGLHAWLWTVDGEDYVPGRVARDIAGAASAAGGRDIVLLHDAIRGPWDPSVLDRGPTVEALGPLIRSLRGKGLRFVTLP